MSARRSSDSSRSHVWSVPKCEATACACPLSSNAGSPNPIVNVRTGPFAWRFIIAATSELSIPPERKAPTGTLLTSRCLTERSTSASNSSRRSSSRAAARPSSVPICSRFQ